MCTLADISVGGAGLIVVNVKRIPDTFELEIKGEDIRRPCRVAWKKDPHRLGVSFVSEKAATELPLPALSA